MTEKSSVGPYFFLSYPHTPERALVLRLYRDLSKEIWERTAWPNDLPPGFVDKRDPTWLTIMDLVRPQLADLHVLRVRG